jgi:UDP-N-acetylmuramyl pentapeptide synthase
LADFLCSHLEEGDNVLIKGSNGMKLTEVIERLEEKREA